MGRQLMDLAARASGKAGFTSYPKSGVMGKAPVVGRLYKGETRDTATQSRYFDLSLVLGAKSKALKDLEESRSFSEAREFKNTYKDYLKLAQISKAHESRMGKIKRDINKRRKAGLDIQKIQLLEQQLESEKLKGMSSVLKQARELGIRV